MVSVEKTGTRQMKQGGVITLALSAIVLFTSACVSEQGIDKAKFTELNRTIQDLKASVSSNDPCDLPDGMEQRLAAGITAVRDRANSKAERDIVAAYLNLLATYKDGLLLCQARSHLSNFDFFPKGRIYVAQELDPLVEKYDLSVEKHLYKPTGQYMRSIDGNSILIIWDSVRAQIKTIENMINYS